MLAHARQGLEFGYWKTGNTTELNRLLISLVMLNKYVPIDRISTFKEAVSHCPNLFPGPPTFSLTVPLTTRLSLDADKGICIRGF